MVVITLCFFIFILQYLLPACGRSVVSLLPNHEQLPLHFSFFCLLGQIVLVWKNMSGLKDDLKTC